jgi:hypothetical protein
MAVEAAMVADGEGEADAMEVEGGGSGEWLSLCASIDLT